METDKTNNCYWCGKLFKYKITKNRRGIKQICPDCKKNKKVKGVCQVCGFVAKSPRGLLIHVSKKHPEISYIVT